MDNEELFEVVLDAIRDLADIHPDERAEYQRGAIFVDDDEFTGTVPVECETITRIEVVQNE
jgi:hypothetical protein